MDHVQVGIERRRVPDPGAAACPGVVVGGPGLRGRFRRGRGPCRSAMRSSRLQRRERSGGRGCRTRRRLRRERDRTCERTSRTTCSAARGATGLEPATSVVTDDGGESIAAFRTPRNQVEWAMAWRKDRRRSFLACSPCRPGRRRRKSSRSDCGPSSPTKGSTCTNPGSGRSGRTRPSPG